MTPNGQASDNYTPRERVTTNYPWDNTRLPRTARATDEEGARNHVDEMTVYAYQDADGNYIDDADQKPGAHVAYLIYPNAAAKRRAQQTGRLGRHTGNIMLVFPNDDWAVVPVYYWRNSGTSSEDLTPGLWDYLASDCLAIPDAIAKRIHPLAYTSAWASYQWCEEAGDGLPLSIEQDADYQAWRASVAWNNERHQYLNVAFEGAEPKPFPTKATFGDGSPVPDEYTKPFAAWMY